MAKHTRTSTTGLSTVGTQGKGRWYGKDGMPNIVKTGANWRHRFSIFHFLLNLTSLQFLLLIVGVYLIINLCFAMVYFYIGADALGMAADARCNLTAFWNCFFFSAQTLTTVGYGRLSPISMAANTVSAIESLLGLLMFALITGLSYGRFSRPKGALLFSDHALISPYENGKALMFRIVSARDDILTDVQANLIIALTDPSPNATGRPEFYTVKLETERIQTLALNWTIVHAITEESPLFGLSMKELEDRKFEALVSIQAYDEYYSNLVKKRTSYTHEDLVDNAKFDIMYKAGDGDAATELLIDKLNDYTVLST
jgi:inward rectifier potassium channel